MSKSLESSVIPPQVQQLFTQLYTEMLASVQAEEASEQVEQLQAEVEAVKAELKGIVFAFGESQKQVMAMAQENERLKLGGEVTQGQDESSAPSSATTKATLAGQTFYLPMPVADALQAERVSMQAEIATLKAQQERPTGTAKASKPKPTPKKAASKPSKAQTETKSSIADQEGWGVGTKKMQTDLTQTKILTRGQTDKVKKAGAKVTGKDGSVWEFTGRNRARNNAKIYERIG
ncbi:MAG: hypothetical protein WA865_03730 [Spirulinaceae cyanobacterium]